MKHNKPLSIFIFLLSTVITLLTMVQVKAENLSNPYSDSENTSSENQILMNEYSSILSTISDPSSRAMFKNKYAEYILKLNEKSDTELYSLNYNDHQIYAIRNFDGSNAMAKAASAYVTGSYDIGWYYYNPNTDKTYVNVYGSVQWNGSPFVKGQDELAAGLKGSSASFSYSSSSCSITYPSGTATSSNYHYYSMAGIDYKFGIADVNSQVFSSAMISYTGVAQGHVTVLDYGIAYAHLTLNISPSATFGLTVGADGTSIGAGVSFSVTSSYSIMYSGVTPYLA